MSRHRYPAEQGCVLLDLTMMFVCGRAIGEAVPNCREDWQCLRGMTGLGEALRSSAARVTIKQVCSAAGVDSAFPSRRCVWGGGAVAAKLPACVKRFSVDASLSIDAQGHLTHQSGKCPQIHRHSSVLGGRRNGGGTSRHKSAADGTRSVAGGKLVLIFFFF